MPTPEARTDRRVLKASLLLCARNRGAVSTGSIASFTGLDDRAVQDSVGRLAETRVLRRRDATTVIGRVCFVALPHEPARAREGTRRGGEHAACPPCRHAD